MKIGFVNSFYAPNAVGGAEYTVQYLAEGLVERGHDVFVVSIAPNGVRSKSELNGVRTYYLPFANIYSQHLQSFPRPFWQKLIWNTIEVANPLMTWRIGKIFAQERPDVVSCHNLRGLSVGAWLAARKQGLPLVQTLHDYFLACPGSVMYKESGKCVGRCMVCRIFSTRRRRLSVLPRVVTGVSRRTLERVEEAGFFGSSTQKEVIFGSNPIGPELPPRVDLPPRSVLRLGFLGRIEPIKGMDVLMRAMAVLGRDTATLLIGGRCSEDERARLRLIAGDADIRFLGHVDPAEFFTQIDLLVVPSVWEEPLGRVIHEGMLYGVPTIASRTGGIPEIVEDGVNGFLFEVNNSEALSRLIRTIWDKGLPANRLSKACLKRSEDFKPTKIFDQYYGAFVRALSG